MILLGKMSQFNTIITASTSEFEACDTKTSTRNSPRCCSLPSLAAHAAVVMTTTSLQARYRLREPYPIGVVRVFENPGAVDDASRPLRLAGLVPNAPYETPNPWDVTGTTIMTDGTGEWEPPANHELGAAAARHLNRFPGGGGNPHDTPGGPSPGAPAPGPRGGGSPAGVIGGDDGGPSWEELSKALAGVPPAGDGTSTPARAVVTMPPGFEELPTPPPPGAAPASGGRGGRGAQPGPRAAKLGPRSTQPPAGRNLPRNRASKPSAAPATTTTTTAPRGRGGAATKRPKKAPKGVTPRRRPPSSHAAKAKQPAGTAAAGRAGPGKQAGRGTRRRPTPRSARQTTPASTPASRTRPTAGPASGRSANSRRGRGRATPASNAGRQNKRRRQPPSASPSAHGGGDRGGEGGDNASDSGDLDDVAASAADLSVLPEAPPLDVPGGLLSDLSLDGYGGDGDASRRGSVLSAIDPAPTPAPAQRCRRDTGDTPTSVLSDDLMGGLRLPGGNGGGDGGGGGGGNDGGGNGGGPSVVAGVLNDYQRLVAAMPGVAESLAKVQADTERAAALLQNRLQQIADGYQQLNTLSLEAPFGVPAFVSTGARRPSPAPAAAPAPVATRVAASRTPAQQRSTPVPIVDNSAFECVRLAWLCVCVSVCLCVCVSMCVHAYNAGFLSHVYLCSAVWLHVTVKV